MSKKEREAKRSDNLKRGIILLIVIAVAVITIYYINDSDNLIQESPLEDGDESMGKWMIGQCDQDLKDKDGKAEEKGTSFSIRFAASQAIKACKEKIEDLRTTQGSEASLNKKICHLNGCEFDSKLSEESCSIESCWKVRNGEICTYNSECFNERGKLIPTQENCDKNCVDADDLDDTEWNCVAEGEYDKTGYKCKNPTFSKEI